MKETERISVLDNVVAKRIKQKHAAAQLGISVRQVRRLLRRYRRDGAEGLTHKNRGRMGNRALPQEKKDQIVLFIRQQYPDFGPTFACEKLAERHGITVSDETVRRLMMQEGLWHAHARKHVAIHTQLFWVGQGLGPVLRLLGPSHATLRDADIKGGGQANGIIIEDADQLGARVFMDRGILYGSATGLLADGLDNTDVTLHNFTNTGHSEGVKVIGGPRAAQGERVDGRVAFFGFGGDTGNYTLNYEVQRGGNLLIYDNYQEDSTGPPPTRLFKLTGSGHVTLSGGGAECSVRAEWAPCVEINNFQGKVALTGSGFLIDLPDPLITTKRPAIVLTGEGRDTKVLDIGMFALGEALASDPLQNTSPQAQLVLTQSARFLYDSTGQQIGEGLIPDQVRNVTDVDGFIRSMLEQTRTQKPSLLTTLPDNVTDVRLFRVSVENALVGIHIKAGVPTTPSPTPLITPTPTRTPTPVSRRPYPDGSLPKQIPGLIQAEDYDIGGEGVSYHDTDSINQGGAYRSDGVDVKVSNDTGL